MNILLLALVWNCTARNATTGDTFSAWNVDEKVATRGAMHRCYFYSGDSSQSCMLDSCTQGPPPQACSCNTAHTQCTCTIDPNGVAQWMIN